MLIKKFRLIHVNIKICHKWLTRKNIHWFLLPGNKWMNGHAVKLSIVTNYLTYSVTSNDVTYGSSGDYQFDGSKSTSSTL